MNSEITLTVDTSRIRPLINLFSELIESHIAMAKLLGCLDQEKVEEWAKQLQQCLIIKA